MRARRQPHFFGPEKAAGVYRLAMGATSSAEYKTLKWRHVVGSEAHVEWLPAAPPGRGLSQIPDVIQRLFTTAVKPDSAGWDDPEALAGAVRGALELAMPELRAITLTRRRVWRPGNGWTGSLFTLPVHDGASARTLGIWPVDDFKNELVYKRCFTIREGLAAAAAPRAARCGAEHVVSWPSGEARHSLDVELEFADPSSPV